MHMRKKKWAPPVLDACAYYYEDCRPMRGKWREVFARPGELQVELGCGKCVSTARMARETPGVNLLALDLNHDVLAVGCRNVDAAFGKVPVDNLRLGHHNLLYSEQIFAPEDAVSRLYISFCNPWDLKGRHERRRLTHTRQLVQYRTFLAPGAQLWFKTDSDTLFSDTLGYLAGAGFAVKFLTRDLHASGFTPNFVTEHEQKFVAQGLPVRFLIAEMEPLAPETLRALRGKWLGDSETQNLILGHGAEACT